LNPTKLDKFWLLVTSALVLLIIIASLIIWLEKDRGELLKISQPQNPLYSGSIFIDGEAARPGDYSFDSSTPLSDLIANAGGDISAALYLRIGQPEIPSDYQKIDINRADQWLLEALPGIGEARARAIIAYRLQSGPFRSIRQITEVPGIDEATFTKIQDYISVE
jgi:competence protein ComEA